MPVRTDCTSVADCDSKLPLQGDAVTGAVESRVDLSTEIPGPAGPIRLAHPILPASGTFGYGEEFEPFVDPGVFAGIIGKSISRERRVGNPPPRTAETPAGMLNSIGLQNPGLAAFVESYLPRMAQYGVPVIVNIVGRTLEDYVELARALDVEPAVAGFELNVSCPNVKEGLQFGRDPGATRDLVAAVRAQTRLPLIAKLTPNVTDIGEQAIAAAEGGADCLSLVNTVMGMSVDWRTRRSRLGTATGGLSGPAIRPLALRMVWEASRAVSIPICGIGGITRPEHVLEFMVVGASTVQVGTHLFRDPACLTRWLGEIEAMLTEEGVQSIRDIVGTFVPPAPRVP
ncbi:MAG: dihydroorotate dehydrogenase [Planctomycetes bacterium]|nr:dihydroorotate dehydrogenase [Planctomycetota bacterium]